MANRAIKDAYNHQRQRGLLKAGCCINGKGHAEPQIDPATGRRRARCEWCRLVHRVGVVKALELAGDHQDNPQPPSQWRLKLRGPNRRD